MVVTPDRKLISWLILKLMLVTVCLGFLTPGVHSMGLPPIGGEPMIGLSAGVLTGSLDGPLTPLNSVLLDECWQPLVPISPGASMVRWEQTGNGDVLLTLTGKIVLGDNADRVLTAEDIISCWESRVRTRWDARWALRGISGIENIDYSATSIFGLQPLDENTIAIDVREGFSLALMEAAMRSPALRLSMPSETSMYAGTGPFSIPVNENGILASNELQHVNAHFAGRPYLEKVSVIQYESISESVLDFGRGHLSALVITSNERNAFNESSRAMPGRIEEVGQALLVLAINPVRLPDPNERRALALSVDRGSISQVVLGEGSSVAGNFMGEPATNEDWNDRLEEARRLYTELENPRERLVLSVPDDPAAIAAAGRIRANWESFGVPVDLVQCSGALTLSMQADIILLSLRIPEGGEGVLPQCLTLYDRNGWWEILATALSENEAELLRSVRRLDTSADPGLLGQAFEAAGLAVPLATYDILIAPGPEISLVPNSVFPGTPLWRAFMGEIPEPVAISTVNGQDE